MAGREAETPPREVPLIRIFLSSPGDVAEERTLARQFIDSELPKFLPFREKVKFELIAWDDPAARIPMLATETPQESVNAARPRPANCLFLLLLLGVAQADQRLCRPPVDEHHRLRLPRRVHRILVLPLGAGEVRLAVRLAHAVVGQRRAHARP